MKTTINISGIIILSAGISFSLFQNSAAFCRDDILEFVNRIAQRRAPYPEMSQWQASVQSTISEMNNEWLPKKETFIQKVVR